MRRVKYRNLLILLALCLGVFSVTQWLTHSASVLVADKISLPDFAFTDDKGQAHHASEFKGHNLIVHVWASWCVPCVAELPALIDYASHHHETIVLAFSVDESVEAMNAFFAKMPPIPDNFLRIWDKDGALTRQYFNVTAYPESFVYDRNHDQISHIEGTIDWANAQF